MKKLFILLTILAGLTMISTQANESDNLQGFKIQFDENKYQETQELYIKGSFSIFVNCGSQYAIWGQFPQAVRYKIKDKKSGVIYESIDMELSISWNGNEVYDEYSEKPCNKIVTENFSENLQALYFHSIPAEPVTDFLVQAEYMNLISEWVHIADKPIVLKKF